MDNQRWHLCDFLSREQLVAREDRSTQQNELRQSRHEKALYAALGITRAVTQRVRQPAYDPSRCDTSHSTGEKQARNQCGSQERGVLYKENTKSV